MASDQERREVAAKLRAKEYERKHPRERTFSPQGMEWYFETYLRDLEECLPDGESAFTVLADLIDQPTTTREKTKKVYGVERPICERCGYGIGDTRWNYCPSCGAEIIVS